MSRLRIGLLTNPTAASGSAHRTGRQVSHLLRLSGISVVDVSGPTAAVARARAREVRDSLTALVVVGGDGTAALGAEIVAESPVRLGVVPAGSGNDLARALDLPVGDPEEAVRRMLDALSRPVVEMDAIEVQSLEGTGRRSLVIGNLSLGFDALVNARANRSQHPGSLRYSTAVVQELRRFADIPYWVAVDGGPRRELDASLVTLANTGVLGGGMRLVPSARVDDGLLDLAAVSGLSRTGLARFFPRVFRGAHEGVANYRAEPVREITIGVRDDRLLRSYGDGEPRALLPVRARVMPAAVRILARIPGSEDAGPDARSTP